MRASAASSGSTQEIMGLVNELPNIAPEKLPFLFPVFYGILDLALIPTVLNRPDSPMDHPTIRLRIVGILFSLCGVSQLGENESVPSAAFLNLWTRIWPWIELLDQECS
jgi:hypothetical protein